jgi:hypothetical protein
MNARGFHGLIAAAAVLVVCGASSAPSLARSATGAPSTLYTRLGGYDFLAKFVDTAFPRVASNDQLRRLFRGTPKTARSDNASSSSTPCARLPEVRAHTQDAP